MIGTRQLADPYGGAAELRFDDVDVPQGGVLLPTCLADRAHVFELLQSR